MWGSSICSIRVAEERESEWGENNQDKIAKNIPELVKKKKNQPEIQDIWGISSIRIIF